MWRSWELKAQSLQVGSWLTGAEDKLRLGEYADAKRLAQDTVQIIETLLGRAKRVQRLAESFQLDLYPPAFPAAPQQPAASTPAGQDFETYAEIGSAALLTTADALPDQSLGRAPEAAIDDVADKKRKKRSARRKKKTSQVEEMVEASEQVQSVAAPSEVCADPIEEVDVSVSQLNDIDIPDAPEDIEIMPPLIFKEVRGELAGNDEGSGAMCNLNYYEASEDGWMMLGHGISDRMMLIRSSPWVRKATRYERCWIDVGSRKPLDYAIYIPKCDDPDYVACGVIFVFKGDNWPKPSTSMPVALVHKALCQPAALKHELWSDLGTGSHLNVRLKLVPGMNTAWPSSASLMGQPPPAFTVKDGMISLYSGVSRVPHPISTRNTFIDFRARNEWRNQRRLRTWPTSSPQAELQCTAAGHASAAPSTSFLMRAAVASLEAWAGQDATEEEPRCVEITSSNESKVVTSSSDSVMGSISPYFMGMEDCEIEYVGGSAFPSDAWSIRARSGLRPRDRLLEHLDVVEIHQLSSASRMLLSWWRTARYPAPSECRTASASFDFSPGTRTRLTSFDGLTLPYVPSGPTALPCLEQWWPGTNQTQVRSAVAARSQPSCQADSVSRPAKPSSPQRISPVFASVDAAACKQPTARRRRPCEAIIPYALPSEVQSLRATCRKLDRYFQSEAAHVPKSMPTSIFREAFDGELQESRVRGAAVDNGMPVAAPSSPLTIACPNDAIACPDDEADDGEEAPQSTRRQRRRKRMRERVKADLQSALRASAPRRFVFPTAYADEAAGLSCDDSMFPDDIRSEHLPAHRGQVNLCLDVMV